MDYLAYNRATLNNRRIKRLDEKAMVFVVPSIIQVGVVGIETRFPYAGRIVDVYATCGTVGIGDTKIDLERCSQEDYDSSPNPTWESMLSNPITIDGNMKSNKTSSSPYSLLHESVNLNDHFRINLLEVAAGIKDITVEVVVELYIEE